MGDEREMIEWMADSWVMVDNGCKCATDDDNCRQFVQMPPPMGCQYGYGLYSDWITEVNGVGLMMELGLTMLQSRFVVRKIPSRARIRAYVCVHGCIYVCVLERVRLDIRTSVGLRAYERGRICANIAGILKYPRNI